MNIQDIYQKTIKFAAHKHTDKNQKIPGTHLPCVVHLSNVAMEILMTISKTENFNGELAVQIALLHDTLEDTDTSLEELENEFGKQVAEGVLALTENSDLDGNKRMADSLQRIKQQPKEIWDVKLADRITNLQTPPDFWSEEKIKNYKQEAIIILKKLQSGNRYLENRLQQKIEKYYIS